MKFKHFSNMGEKIITSRAVTSLASMLSSQYCTNFKFCDNCDVK